MGMVEPLGPFRPSRSTPLSCPTPQLTASAYRGSALTRLPGSDGRHCAVFFDRAWVLFRPRT